MRRAPSARACYSRTHLICQTAPTTHRGSVGSLVTLLGSQTFWVGGTTHFRFGDTIRTEADTTSTTVVHFVRQTLLFYESRRKKIQR